MKSYISFYSNLKWHILNIDDFSLYDDNSSLVFSTTDRIVSFQVSDLLRSFKKNKISTIPNIICLESFDKQMSGEGRDLINDDNWMVLKLLRRYNIIDTSFELKEGDEKKLMVLIANVYISLYENDAIEKDRFDSVEIMINRIIYNRQLKGIRVNKNIAKSKCKDLERYIYDIKNELQLSYNIFAPDNQQEQIEILKKYGYYDNTHSISNLLKTQKNRNIILKLLYELNRSSMDFYSLLYILSHYGGDERVFPDYLGFGTITSRIMLRNPSLQNLRKSLRKIIVPDGGKKFLYVDYSQFEAGILASLSKDDDLIKLYDKDIYDDIIKEVLSKDEILKTISDGTELRKEAKILFYRYMYGDTMMNTNEINYFRRFKKLSIFKENIERELDRNKRIGTLFGNFRSKGDKENVWALSHVIQGTASLIFKNALIRLQNEVPTADLLLPMHDAALYQVDNLLFETDKKKIMNIFEAEFKKLCPNINPTVHEKNFYN